MGTAWLILGSHGGSGSSKCSATKHFFSALQLALQWLTALIQALRDVQAASTSACAGDSPGGSKRRTATGNPRSPAADGDGSPGGPAGALRAFFGQRLSGERGSLKRSASNGQMQPVCPSLLHGEAGLTEGEHMGTVLPQMRMGLLLVLACQQG